MFHPLITKEQLRDVIDGMSELDVARFLYCQEMAGTYIAVGKFENMLIAAMHMCDRVNLKKGLGEDRNRWESSLEKQALLEGSTLGTLITILERHKVDKADIGYLRWLKDKRDYFVHRLFHDDAWPGELDAESCLFMRRRLLAIQLWLGRGERNIWSIFERAGYVELDRTPHGILAMNAGLFDEIQDDIVSHSADTG